MPNENLEKLVQYARNKKPVAFKELLHSEIGSRMSTKISDIKTNLSKTMFQTGKEKGEIDVKEGYSFSQVKKAIKIADSLAKKKKEEVELDEGKMKDLSMRIDRIVANLKKNRKTKGFADKFKKDVMKTMDIEKSLENVLPGYKKGDKRYWAGNLDVEEGYSSSQVKKAIKIAHDMGGNMTGAVKKIERIKRGLSDDEAVEDALKLANEEVELDGSVNESSYHKAQITDFIKKNKDVAKLGATSKYLPKIQIHGTESKTKYLDISFEALEQLAKIMMKESVVNEGSKEEYQKFFNSKLAKYKVKSPAELDDAQKKKFFNEIEKEWKSEDE